MLSNRKRAGSEKKSTHLPYGCSGPFVEVCPEMALLFTLGTLAMLEARERTSVPSIDHTILAQLGILQVSDSKAREVYCVFPSCRFSELGLVLRVCPRQRLVLLSSSYKIWSLLAADKHVLGKGRGLPFFFFLSNSIKHLVPRI